jgi:hypothetical protein
MEDKIDLLESLVSKAEAYGKAEFELVKFKAIDKSANVLSSMISQGVAIILVLLFVIIASIGVALWLGETLGKTYYGFFYVAGVYGFFGIILYFAKENWIKRSVNDSIIANMFN